VDGPWSTSNWLRVSDQHGRTKLDAVKVNAAEKFDGKFVVITNDDDTLSAEDV
jgi:hypothetical protein